MKCAVVKHGPLTEWWALLLPRAFDKRLIRSLDCVHHCRTASTMAVAHTSSSSSRRSSSFKERTGGSMPAWSASVQRGPTTICLWYCCEKHFHSLDRSAVICRSRPPSWLWTYLYPTLYQSDSHLLSVNLVLVRRFCFEAVDRASLQPGFIQAEWEDCYGYTDTENK